MERYVDAARTELEEHSEIEDLMASKHRSYSLLLKVRELRGADGSISATIFRKESKMDTHVFHVIRDWLVKQGYLEVDKVGQRKWFRLSEKGVDALDRRDMVMRLEEHSQLLYNVRSFEEEMEGLNLLFGVVFSYSWRRLKRFRDRDDYYQFLDAVEGSSYRHLNENMVSKISDIKKGNLRGYLEDPYFSIQRRFLPAIYFDAVLALKLEHYLTYNHSFVLIAASEASEEELVLHNQRWSRKYMEEEIIGEDDPHAQYWRLNPRFTVRQELWIRGDHRLLPEHAKLCGRSDAFSYNREHPAFYDRDRRLYSRDGFLEDPRWSIDLDKTIENYENRKRIKEAGRLGLTPSVLAEMKSLAAYEPRFIDRADGVYVEYYDGKGVMIKTLKIR